MAVLEGSPIVLQGLSQVTILLVAPYTSRGGGMGRIMAYLAASAAEPGVRFETIESRGGGSAFSSLGPFLRAAWHIRRRARGEGRVILHVNMAERGSVLRKGALLLLGKWLGLPTVLHLHAAEMLPFYNGLPALAQTCVRFIFRSASVCVVLGYGSGQWLHAVLGVSRDRIEVLANGVPMQHTKIELKNIQCCNLLFLGNLQARKGLRDLLCALSVAALAGRDWTLNVAGGGDPVPFQRQARQLGMESRVQFQGWLDRDACTRLLSRADLLILPSYNEGLPLVLLEAASLGIPSVTTPVGAIPEVFTDQTTAVFVAPGDIDALAASILRMIDEPDLRAMIGRNAKRLYDTSLSMEIFSQAMSAIYREHCGDPLRHAHCLAG